MAYCKQCGHNTLMQQEEIGSLYQCGYCGYKEHRCPECKSGMREQRYVTEAMAAGGLFNIADFPIKLVCSCGYEEKVKT